VTERRLGPMRRALLGGEILRAYVVARWLLLRRPLPDALAALRAPGARRAAGDDGDRVALGRHLAWATVRTIDPLPLDSRCLMRSLVLTRLLARRALTSTFVLSAAPGPRFEAHAWVELDGEPLLRPAGAQHQQLVRL
jgi:hypothetical protein